MVWLDINEGRLDLEERLLGVARQTLPHLLKTYLRDFISDSSYIERPFIETDTTDRYRTIPSEIKELRDRMLAEESGRNYLAQQDAAEPPTTDVPVELLPAQEHLDVEDSQRNGIQS